MAGNSRSNRCNNRRNHNCNPCSICNAVEHDWDRYGEKCKSCGHKNKGNEWEDYQDIPEERGQRRKRFDDEEDRF